MGEGSGRVEPKTGVTGHLDSPLLGRAGSLFFRFATSEISFMNRGNWLQLYSFYTLDSYHFACYTSVLL